jgi:hypothetical protein
MCKTPSGARMRRSGVSPLIARHLLRLQTLYEDLKSGLNAPCVLPKPKCGLYRKTVQAEIIVYLELDVYQCPLPMSEL